LAIIIFEESSPLNKVSILPPEEIKSFGSDPLELHTVPSFTPLILEETAAAPEVRLD